MGRPKKKRIAKPKTEVICNFQSNPKYECRYIPLLDEKPLFWKDRNFISTFFLMLATAGFLGFQYLTYHMDDDLRTLDSLNSQRALVERGILYSQYEFIKAEAIAAHINSIRENKLPKELEDRYSKQIMPALKRSAHMANKAKENSKNGVNDKIDTRCLRYYVEEDCSESEAVTVSGTFITLEKDINSYPKEYDHAKYLALDLARQTILNSIPQGINRIEQEMSEKAHKILQNKKYIDNIWIFSVVAQFIGLVAGLGRQK